jgi:hypothetical protein
MRALFLDTATQFARHWHADSERDEIQRQLKGRTLYCSRYVKCQYKAILLNPAIALHNLLVRFKDLNRAMRESKRYRNEEIAHVSLKEAVQKRIDDIGHWMLEYRRNYEEQKQRLQDLIEDVWETQFHCGIERPLIDETGCVYADDTPELDERETYDPVKVSCTVKDPPSCRIRQFWSNHSVSLELLANMDIKAIKAQPKDIQGLQKVADAAQEVRGGRSTAGKRCTVDLSDPIICLEGTHCPATVAIHSINKKHFKPLCEVLGIESEPRS